MCVGSTKTSVKNLLRLPSCLRRPASGQPLAPPSVGLCTCSGSSACSSSAASGSSLLSGATCSWGAQRGPGVAVRARSDGNQLHKSFSDDEELDKDLATDLANKVDPERMKKMAKQLEMAWSIRKVSATSRRAGGLHGTVCDGAIPPCEWLLLAQRSTQFAAARWPVRPAPSTGRWCNGTRHRGLHRSRHAQLPWPETRKRPKARPEPTTHPRLKSCTGPSK